MGTVIRTILGDIDPAQWGPSNMHDHLVRDDGTVEVLMDKDFLMESQEVAARELEDFYQHGGRGFLDAMPLNCGRNIEKYLYVAQRVPGVHIVATTGFHKGQFYLPSHWVYDYSINEMVDLCLPEICEGIEINEYNGPYVKRSQARAGCVKAGTGYQKISPVEDKMLRASARVQVQTGVLLLTHCDQGTMAHAQLDIFQSEGVDLRRVMIGHIDRNPDPYLHITIAKRGATLEYDTPGRIKYQPESAVVECLRQMIAAGFEDQIVLAGDNGRRSYLKNYGGGPGYAYVLEHFVPRLRDQGFSEAVLNKILVETPRRLLSFNA